MIKGIGESSGLSEAKKDGLTAELDGSILLEPYVIETEKPRYRKLKGETKAKRKALVSKITAEERSKIADEELAKRSKADDRKQLFGKLADELDAYPKLNPDALELWKIYLTTTNEKAEDVLSRLVINFLTKPIDSVEPPEPSVKSIRSQLQSLNDAANYLNADKYIRADGDFGVRIVSTTEL